MSERSLTPPDNKDAKNTPDHCIHRGKLYPLDGFLSTLSEMKESPTTKPFLLKDINNTDTSITETKKELKKQPKKNRCAHEQCGKRIKGLIPWKCSKCENTFCTKCRHPEEHDCSKLQLYKQHGREQLEKDLVRVVASKIDMI